MKITRVMAIIGIFLSLFFLVFIVYFLTINKEVAAAGCGLLAVFYMLPFSIVALLQGFPHFKENTIPCPNCEKYIKKTNRICEYCGKDLMNIENIPAGKVVMLNAWFTHLSSFIIFSITFISISFFYYSIWDRNILDDFNLNFTFLIILTFSIVISMAIHELLHGLCYIIFDKKSFKQFEVKILWRKLLVNFSLKEDVTVFTTRISLLAPFIFLGLTPIIAGLVFKSFFLIMIGSINISSSAADLYFLWELRKTKSNVKLADFPGKVGFIIKE